MGNPKEWVAGEMSGEKLRNHSFQETRGGSRCKVREAGAEVWGGGGGGGGVVRLAPPPPPPFLKEACILFSRMCLSFAADVLICYFCLFALLFFSFVFSKKEKAQTLLKLFE